MTKGIVDVLEAVQIKGQHRHLLDVAPRQDDGLAEPVIQQQPVG